MSWEAVGSGITTQTGTGDFPQFDFSSNVGNDPITITITSPNNFATTRQVLAPGLDIISVDLSNLNQVENIELPNNLLTSIDLSQNTQLQIIGLENNQLTAIDLSANTALLNVEVQNNDLTVLDVSSSPSLEYLDANNNELSSINVSGNPNLNFLDLSSNDLTTIDVSGNAALELLNLDFNQLTTATIGQVLIDVNAFGTSNGELGLQGNPGTIPAGSIPAYNALLSRNWTIRPPVIYDFGDARGYGTNLNANGPQHIVGTRDIKLGLIVDSETNVNPNVAATTDDTTNLDDEDALEASDFVGIKTSSDSFSVEIDYTNNYTTGATIYAWLDFDIDGNFDPDEFTSVAVPNGGFGTVTLTWSNLIGNGVDINGGITSARFRITTDPLAPNQTGGVATDGEVEDYGNIEIELDTDKDGVVDSLDLDDDNDGILDTVEDNGVVDRDTDGDGDPDRIDLDSDGDTCFDVTEAGFADGDADGEVGTGPLGVDADGKVISDANGPINEPADAYGPPNDLDNNGTPDFQEAGAIAVITTEPTDQELIIGDVTFSVVAVADTYRWQQSTDGGANWTDIADGGDYAGATTADLVVTNSDISKITHRYRVIVDNVAFACAAEVTSVDVGYIIPDDFDLDGVFDIVDVDDDNDGILDTVEDNGVVDRDTDGDGNPDRIDWDSDDDNCFDVTEAGFTDNGMGMLGTTVPPVVDANGQVTSATDGYTAPNDLDGNGTPDFQEAGAAASITTQPLDQDLIIGDVTFSVVADADTYQWQESTDGGANWADIADGGDYAGATTADLVVSNSDISKLTYRYRVIVSNIAFACDPTTISNAVGFVNPDDFDNDGVPDLVDLDDDNDGILDTVEDNGVVDRDTDGDGNPDRIDWDSDDDNCFDVTEAGFTDNGMGMLGTTVPPVVDANGQVTSATDGYTAPNDLDGNGTPDFQEAGEAATLSTQPTDQNLVPGASATFSVVAVADTYQWEESTDGGANWNAVADGGNYSGATTADLTVSNLDVSMAGYLYRVTVSNVAYACDPTTVSGAAGFIQLDDTDNDGVPDLVDVDDDNDGIFDTVEDNGVIDRDTDGNGVPDRIQLDADGDGCYDVTEAGFTDNGMGMLGTVAPPLVDANGQVTSATDGYTTPNDLDGNGTPDFQEAGEGASISADPVDQDFILNGSAVFTVSANGDAYQWQVSTNGTTWMDLTDGGNYSGANTSTLTVSDLVISIYGESYRVIVSNLAFACDPGAISASATYNVLDDTDNDGVYDIVDVDDDNDGILDAVEGEDTDSNNDGTPDRISLDADGDGCFDVTEAGFEDPDGDGILGTSPVAVDGDGQVTGQGGYTTPNDLNNNGVFDFQEAGSPSSISNQPVDVTIALGQDAVFQVSGNATYYQWQESADGSTWVDLVNGADYMGVDTQTMTVVDARGKLEGNRYRVVLRSPDFACDPNPDLISEDVRLIFNTSLIPSGFSPNGDGENDVFLIPGLREYPNFTMEVFDRWGNSVYKYDNNGSPNLVWWDGRSTGNMTMNKGELVPAGTYFYHIEYNGGGKSADTGWVYVNY